jgi:O-antigen ligase
MGLIALILTASYIGLMSFLLGGLFLSWSVYTKSIKGFLVVVLMAIVLAGVFLSVQPDPDRFYKMIDLSERSSVSVRVQVWEVAMRLMRDNGIWGIGLGNFQNSYFDIVGSMFDPPLEWKMLHAHNVYIHTFLEMTLFGLIIFISTILSIWGRAVNLLKSVDYYWLYGLLAIILAWVVGGLFDITYYKNDLAVLFWVVAALILGTANIYVKSIKGVK